MHRRFFPPRLIPIATLVALACVPLAAQPQIEWTDRIDVAMGNGERGPWRQNQSNFDYVDDPTVAPMAGGGNVVAWVDNAKKDVLLQIYDAEGNAVLDEPANVSRSSNVFSWMPRVVVDVRQPQHVHVLWQEIVFSGGSHGGDAFYARSTDGGRTFAVPRNLSSSVTGDGKGRINERVWHNGSHDLAIDPRGMLFAAWTDYEGTLWFVRSVRGDGNFSSPKPVAGTQQLPARAPSLSVGPDGAVYLAWTVGEDPRADIRVAKSTNHGESFQRPVLVAGGPGFADAPKIAADPHGVVHLAYAESRDGPFAPAEIFYTQSIDGGLTFRESRAISRPTPEGVIGAAFPAAAVNRDGAVCVTWELFPIGGDRPRGLGYAVSIDGGGFFTAPAIVPASADLSGFNGSQQGLLMRKLALGQNGAVVVANSSFTDGQSSRVWLMRGRIQPR